MKIVNRTELTKWRQPLIDKGYSFMFIKGYHNGIRINVAIKCIETNETFHFIRE